jgi:hypothetical protein
MTDCMSVELDFGNIDGGALFEWALAIGRGFIRRRNSLPQWLTQIATRIDGGCFRRIQTTDGLSTLRVPHPRSGLDGPETDPFRNTMQCTGGDCSTTLRYRLA